MDLIALCMPCEMVPSPHLLLAYIWPKSFAWLRAPDRPFTAPPPEEEENSGSVYDHNDHHSNHHSNHNNNQDNRNDQRFIDSREGENEGQDELATAPAVRGRVVAGSSESSQGRPGTSVENANIAAGTRPMLHLDMGCTTAEDEPASRCVGTTRTVQVARVKL